MTTLTTYILRCRRLLHDANANFWSDSELTDYINSARQRTVRDTGCLRSLQSASTVASQEVYTFSGLGLNAQTMDVLNINLLWGNSRIPLYYMAWSDFNARLRYWQNYIGRPIAFSMYGPQQFYLGPSPDQIYTLDIDTVLLPTDLVNGSDVDSIPVPFDDPVAFYACYTAKYKEQSYGEAEIFKNEYEKKVLSVLNTTFTRRLPTPFTVGG